MIRQEACATGAAELGSCPTDATREGRRRRVVLKFAAMPTLERLRQQSSRPFWPGGSIQASVPELHNPLSQTGLGLLSRLTERQP
jgi:hypothetical protein